MHRRSFLALGTLALPLTACAGEPWHVVVLSAPNLLFGQRRLAVAPIEYAGLMIGRKPEPVYLAGKDTQQQLSFQEDKAALNQNFLANLLGASREFGIEVVPATGPADAPFLIKPAVGFIEPGFYGGIVHEPSEVRMDVKIITPDGRLVDEIELTHGTSPASGFKVGGISMPSNPSSGGRLRKDGEALGRILAEYLQARVNGGG